MPANIMGWDIGGAHLKAAVIQSPDTVLTVQQCPCPLWQGLDRLSEAVGIIQKALPYKVSSHVLTMTGELVDLFPGREEGVRQILALMQQLLPESDIVVYVGKQGFLPLAEINASHYVDIASSNWLASATWVAQTVGNGLFVDIGSTTTDILAFDEGMVLAEGFTDYERLQSRELVYTGIVRTPVMALVQSVEDQGKQVGIMAEYFATMADVYRLSGELNEAHDQSATADGAVKTVAASARRLARMVGCDLYEEELTRWRQVAAHLRAQQIAYLQSACALQLAKVKEENSPIIGAGIGRFLVENIASNLGCPYKDITDFVVNSGSTSGFSVADCLPSVAVAMLYLNQSSIVS